MVSLELRQIGRAGSDCTAPYEVIIHGKCTVREFVECVLTHHKEWGYIGISDGSIFGNPRIEYARGTITTENTLKDIKDYIVVKALASGGWSRMDYLLTIEQESEDE